MSQAKNIRRAALVAAVGAAFAGDASAITILGAGASAVKNSVQLIILKDYCSTGTINFFDNGTGTIAAGGQPGGGTFRIQCAASSLSQFTAPVDIGYDTSGGSWKAFTALNTSLFAQAQTTGNANPVSTVATTGCTVQSNIAMAVLGSTFTINYNYGCTLQPLTAPPSFGLTDVEKPVFLNSLDNQPLVNNTWAVTSTGTVPLYSAGLVDAASNTTPVFGVVLGIGASPKLYSALQVDQIASGLIPSTCVAGAVAGSTSAQHAVCAPVITRAQYASIVAASGGALNTSLHDLFTNTIPAATTFELARRDQGSGTQSASNAYFLNIGCASANTEPGIDPQLPFGSASNVSYNATTGNVQTKLQTPTLDGGTGFAIGVVSVENESKFTGGAGFLKLDGFYPSVANAQKGLYSFVSEENLHFNANIAGDAVTFNNDLVNQNPASTTGKLSESAFNYGLSSSVAGIVPIFSQLNTAALYGNGGNICAGWQHN